MIWLIIAAFLAIPGTILANPTGHQVIAGAAEVSRSDLTLRVTQNTDRAIINWQDFSINAGEWTEFLQPSASSAVLNRVIGEKFSSIMGTLSANGAVYLINPNGIVVGPSGVINVQSFLGSTLNVSNDQFMSGGDFTFLGDSQAGIKNEGTIEALGGDVVLMAREVRNEGTIQAAGLVALAAGGEVLLKAEGEERVFVNVGLDQNNQGITNKGLIEAATVELKAVQGNVYALAIHNEGTIRANDAIGQNGRIFLKAENGKIENSGALSAKGGSVEILAPHVALNKGSLVDVSAENGGGEVFVASNEDVEVEHIFVADGATIKADAMVSGDGGDVVLIAEDMMEFRGHASVQALGETGDGGFVEVSGKENLLVAGSVDARSQNGAFGELLLDPGTVTIMNGPNTNVDFNTFYDDYIQAQLALANVTIQTSAATNGLPEDIDVLGATNITWAAATKLTLIAGRLINMRWGAHIENTNTSMTGTAIELKANQEATSTSGKFNGVAMDHATILSNSGDIEIYGRGGDTDSNNYGIILKREAQIASTGTGTNAANIIISGTGGAVTSANHGVFILDTGTNITTVDGNITVTGQGGGNGTSSENYGVVVYLGAKISSTGTGSHAGQININATGGNGTYANYGLALGGSGSEITSAQGNINIQGQGGAGTTTRNCGIYLSTGSKITSTGTGSGAADIILNGTGGTGTTSNHGIYIKETGSAVTTIDGDITATSLGGNGSISSNYGMLVSENGQIASTGTGKISITTTGGTGTASNCGLGFGQSGKITTVDGEIEINAQGGSGTSTNQTGIYITATGQIQSTGTGQITLNGTGGSGSYLNQGIFITGTNAKVTSNQGNITLTGQGGSGGFSNHGIQVASSGQIQSTATGTSAAKITLNGTGGNGTHNNHGVIVSGSGSKITSIDGNIGVDGTGGTNSGNTNYGIMLYSGGQITSTGQAAIQIAGTGGNSTAYNYGVLISAANSKITSQLGNITVIGLGQGSSYWNHGIYLANGGAITSTGTGDSAANITFDGTGSTTGTIPNYGAFIDASPSTISSVDGGIIGIGRAGPGQPTNDGIKLRNGATITSTGAGGIILFEL